MTPAPPPKPFSMIREFHLADWFTLGNAVCGTGALFSTMTYLETSDVRHVYFACALVFAALIFDILDGRIARWRQQSSILGRELRLWRIAHQRRADLIRPLGDGHWQNRGGPGAPRQMDEEHQFLGTPRHPYAP